MSTSLAEMKHWTRWTTASIAKHFFDTKEDAMQFFLEGTIPQDADSIATERLELFIEGPSMSEISADCWKLSVEIGILVSTKKLDTDLYRHSVNIGNVVDDILRVLDVYKYGTGGDDDDTLAFCLIRQSDVLTRHFGQPDAAKLLQQSSVEGEYEVIFQV